MVAHFVRGIGQHQHHFVCTLGDAPQADGKPVTAEDGENNTHAAAAKLGAHIRGHILHRSIVALRTGHDGLSHSNDVTILDLITAIFRGSQHRVGHDLHQIIALADNRRPDTSGNRTNHTAHKINTFNQN